MMIINNKSFNETNDYLCIEWLTNIYNNVKKLNVETSSTDISDEQKINNLINGGIVGLNVPGQPNIVLSNLKSSDISTKLFKS